MTAKTVLIYHQGLRPGARASTCPPATPFCLRLFLQDLEFTLPST